MSEPLASSYRELLDQAAGYLRAKDWNHATEALERIVRSLSRLSYSALKKRPEMWGLFVAAYSEGIYFARRIRHVERIRSLQECVSKVMPLDDPLTHILLATADTALGELDQAKERLAGRVQISDLSFYQRIEFARLALQVYSPELAVQALEGAEMPALPQDEVGKERVQRSTADYWRLYIIALLQAGRFDAIDTPLRRLWEIAPQRAPYPLIVKTFLDRKDHARALEYADAIPELAARGLLRGLVAAVQGKMDWARDEWWRVAREPLDVAGERMNLDAWVECALRLGDIEKAANALESADIDWEKAPWFRVYRVLYLAKRGEPAETLPAFREALEDILVMEELPLIQKWMAQHISDLVTYVLEGEDREAFLAVIREMTDAVLVRPTSQEA